MPSLDIFTGIQKEDDEGIQSFLLAHKCRHQTYAYAASVTGVSTPPYDFSGEPDDDWFVRHASAHQALQPFMVPDQTVDLTVLTNYTWQDDQSFSTWMQMHTLIHQRLDEYFGVFS
jgi:hypothetical protein